MLLPIWCSGLSETNTSKRQQTPLRNDSNPPKVRTVKGETLTSMVVAKEKLVRHVKLDNGEIKCPYCQIELVMDAVMDTIFLERQCPSYKKSFVIVNEAPEEEIRKFTRSAAQF